MLSSGHILSQKSNRSLQKFASSRYRSKLEELSKNSSQKSFNSNKFKRISPEDKLRIKKEVQKEINDKRTIAVLKTIATITIIIIACLFILS